ncbi:MAG: hypothetical protein C0478_14345 [Planctomyces sp.]|nr:hypothetical protein [Planctomyces sp.]
MGIVGEDLMKDEEGVAGAGRRHRVVLGPGVVFREISGGLAREMPGTGSLGFASSRRMVQHGENILRGANT